MVNVKHVKHCIDLVFAEICHHSHECQELDIWAMCIYHTVPIYMQLHGLTIQSHLSPYVNGFEKFKYHAHATGIEQTVRLVQP